MGRRLINCQAGLRDVQFLVAFPVPAVAPRIDKEKNEYDNARYEKHHCRQLVFPKQLKSARLHIENLRQDRRTTTVLSTLAGVVRSDPLRWSPGPYSAVTISSASSGSSSEL
jgi:hypothetical protein